jgi:hypothetical protein
MRIALRLMILAALALFAAACQSAPEATATSAATTAPNPPTTEAGTDSTAEVSPEVQTTVSPVVIDITVPPPGTLVSAAATQDPLAQTGFTSIIYEQKQGSTGTPLTVEVYSDGRVVRDGVASTISAEQVAAIDAALRAVNFFGLQGQFIVPGTNEDIYYYTITVDVDGSSRMIRAQDGYTPDELMALFNTISVLGSGAPSA